MPPLWCRLRLFNLISLYSPHVASKFSSAEESLRARCKDFRRKGRREIIAICRTRFWASECAVCSQTLTSLAVTILTPTASLGDS
jgi:hypothetical protein